MNAADWIEAYRRAWVGRDPEAAVALFTEDAVYRSSPFREPSVGSDGIREYWARATSTQEELDLRFGEPVAEGDKVVVEWWAIMRDEGEWVTLPGALLLRFASDGRCEELREYWHFGEGRRTPPPCASGCARHTRSCRPTPGHWRRCRPARTASISARSPRRGTICRWRYQSPLHLDPRGQ